MNYTFTLRYRLNPANLDIATLMERLDEAGCDDALVGIGIPGYLALEFTRQATSEEEAVCRARAEAGNVLGLVAVS